MRTLALALALHAEPPPVDVRWQADASCPVARFHARLAAYLEGATRQRPVRVTAEIRRDKRWTADLVVTSADGRTERQLTGNACDELVDAAAFVTAVVVDPGVLTRPPPAEPAEPPADPTPAPTADPVVPRPDVAPDPNPTVPAPPSPSPSDPTPVRPVQKDTPPPPPRDRARIGGFVRVAAGLEGYALPRVAPTANLTAGLLGRRWRVELGGTYRAPTNSPPGEFDPQVHARIRLWTVAARGCGVLRASVLEFPLCAGLEAGQTVSAGEGLAEPKTRYEPWLAALVGPALVWAPRRWFALWLGVELGVPFLRRPFEVKDLGVTLYTVKPVSLRAGFGLELRFF